MAFPLRKLGKWIVCIGLMFAGATPLASALGQEWSPRPRSKSAIVAQPTFRDPAVRPAAGVAQGGAVQKAFIPEWQRNPRQRPAPVRTAAHRHYQEREVLAPPEEMIEEITEEPMPVDEAPEMIAPGRATPSPRPQPDVQYETEAFGDGEFIEEGMSEWEPGMPGEFGPEFESCGDCGDCGDCNPAFPCDGICIPRRWIDETSLSVGTQAFKGPLDQGINGNFGFHEGVGFGGQFGTCLGLAPLGIGYQVGGQFTQSNFSGSLVGQQNGVAPHEVARDQQFLTAGLFRRAERGRGFQCGAVFDWMHDNYYVDINLTQVRGEISYLFPCRHEIGFWGAFGTHGDTVFSPGGASTTFFSTDLYTLFYRHNLPNGAQGRVWGGASGTKDGLIGADFRMPLSNRWDLNGGVNYLIPGQRAGLAGYTQETWGLSMNLVWYPGRRSNGIHNGPFRSLFNVADNGVFMVDRR